MILLKELYLQDLGTFWQLRVFLFIIFLFAGWGITYKNNANRYFWYYAIPLIIFYCLIQGLRFDRGIDYYHYYEEIKGQYNVDIDREPLYSFILSAGQGLGVPFWATFIMYSAIFITGFMLVLKRLPRLAIWALPLFFLITIVSSENLIRQYLAFSFLFFAYAFYLSDNKVWMYISLLCVPLLHLSGLFGVGLFWVFMKFDLCKILKSPIALLGFYLLLVVVWDVANFDEFATMVSGVGGLENTYYQGYIDNADRWFTQEGSLSVLGDSAGEVGIMTVVLQTFINALLIWFGFYAYKENQQLRIPFFMTYIAILIFQISGDIELFRRFGWWCRPFEAIIGAAILVRKQSKVIWWGIFGSFLLFYFVRFFLQLGKMPQFGCAFVWDIV